MSGGASHASGRGTGLPTQAPIHGVAEEGPLKILATDSFAVPAKSRNTAPIKAAETQ
jgi:hypothetical protein